MERLAAERPPRLSIIVLDDGSAAGADLDLAALLEPAGRDRQEALVVRPTSALTSGPARRTAGGAAQAKSRRSGSRRPRSSARSTVAVAMSREPARVRAWGFMLSATSIPRHASIPRSERM